MLYVKKGSIGIKASKLLNYDISSESIKNSFDDIIKLFTENDSKRFANLRATYEEWL